MRGSIRVIEKGKRYEVRVALGRDPLTGRYRQKSVSVRGTRREAERVLRGLVEESERSNTPISAAPPEARTRFQELLEQWIEHKDNGERSPTTITRYRQCIDQHLVPALGQVPIGRLTPKAFDDLYRNLARSLSPATVLKNHLVARSALDTAVRWEWLERNPAQFAEVPKARRASIHPPTTAELTRLVTLAETTDPVFAVVLRLGAATGARRGELCGLRWSDVDFDAGTLVIERGVILVKGGVEVRPTKTHNRRVVTLDDGTLGVLRTHRRSEVETALAAGVTLAPDAYVFSRRPGGTHPLRPDNCSETFVEVRDALGLSGFTMKDATRHLAATRLIGAGVDVRTVAGRLGHARASTTLDVYSHFLPERDREAAELLGALLDEPSTTTGQS
ncbi:MAG: site-specific integrase [Acidimicrobiia bacterium]